MRSLQYLTDSELVRLDLWFDSLTTRQRDTAIHQYSTKHAYHVVRLLNEVEQILMHGDIDLMQNNDQLKDVRNGEWSLEFLEQYFEAKEVALEKCYHQSELQKYPDEAIIKQLLLDCLEEFYGSVSNDDIQMISQAESTLMEIKRLVNKHA